MTIAVDQNLGSGGADSAGTTVALTTTAAAASGTTITLFVTWLNSITLSSVSGGGLTWTIDKQDNTSAIGAAIVSAPAPAGLASSTVITATYSASAAGGRFISATSFTGVATSSPVDGTPPAAHADGATGAWTSNTATVLAGSVIVSNSMESVSLMTSTPTSPSIELQDYGIGGSGATANYRLPGSAGSFAVAGTWSGTPGGSSSNTIAVAYKAAPAAASVAPQFFLPRTLGPMAVGPTFFAALPPPLPPAPAAAPAIWLPPLTYPQIRNRTFFIVRGRRAFPVPLPDPPILQQRSPAVRREPARRPRGQFTFPVQPQIPVPPTIPGNRTSSLARRLFALAPRGKNRLPTQPQIPVPPTIPGNRQPAGRRWQIPVRGRRWFATPPQDPVWPNRTSPWRSRFTMLRRGRQVLPTPPQVTVPPTIPPKVGAPRRLLNATARGRQWSAATLAQPIVTLIWPPPRLGAKRLLSALARGKRTAAPADQTTASKPARATRYGVHARRGVANRPPLAQDNPVRQTRTPGRITRLIRGRAATPTPPQVPVPPTVVPRTVGKWRWAALRRGRQTNPVLTQASTAPPAWPPPKLGAPRRLLSIGTRGRRWFPTPPQTPVPKPAIPRTATRWRWAAVRRGRQSNPVLTQEWPTPKLGAPRRLLSIGTRGRKWFPTPAQIAVPKPVFPNRAPKLRLFNLARRGRRTSVVGAPPQPPTICYPTTALIVPYASAPTFVPYASAPTFVSYSSTTTIPGRNTATGIVSYGSTGAITGHDTAGTVVTYTTAVTHFNTCAD